LLLQLCRAQRRLTAIDPIKAPELALVLRYADTSW
jgi:hypothetical protein